MAELYMDGFTLKQIGVIHDVHQERVRQILNEMQPGFTRRGGYKAPEPSPSKPPVNDELRLAHRILNQPGNHSIEQILWSAEVVGHYLRQEA